MCGIWSGGNPANCAATHKAMANASAVESSAMVVTSPLEKRLPNSPLMAAPASGSNGMIHKCIFRFSLSLFANTVRVPPLAKSEQRRTKSVFLQLQQVHAIHIQGLAGTEYRDDDGQSHGRFRGSHYHHEEHENVTVERLELRGEGNEGKIDAVQHQLNRLKNGDDVALDQEACNSTAKQDRAQHQIVGKRDHLLLPPRQDYGAHDGDQDQQRRHLERQQEVAEQQTPDGLGISEHVAPIHHRGPADRDAVQPGEMADHPDCNAQSNNESRDAQHHGRSEEHTSELQSPMYLV